MELWLRRHKLRACGSDKELLWIKPSPLVHEHPWSIINQANPNLWSLGGGGGIIPWRGGASLFKLDNRCVNTVFFRKIVISFEWAWNLGNMYLNDHCSWIVSILKYNSFNTNKIIIIFNLMLLIFLNVYDSLMFLRVIVFSEILNSD